MTEKTNTPLNGEASANKEVSGLESAIKKPLETYQRQRYNTPLFVLREMIDGFQRHNTLALSASLSFYAMFALIPLLLLAFFLLSHLVFNSDYAIIKLAIITGNLVPKLSSAIMVEIYHTAQQKAAWGAAGLFVLLWAVTPLAGAMRATFYTIASIGEAPSYLRGKIKDLIAVVGILILFFLFTFVGLVLEEVMNFLGESHPFFQNSFMVPLTSLLSTTLLISSFYFVFFPVRLYFKHIFLGAFFTATLWLLMRPAFTLFLSMNESYNSMFGSMKNLFVSISWLYFNFIVFLLGTELIATLRKKNALMLKNLFTDTPRPSNAAQANYTKKLMQRYGKIFQKGEHIFNMGDPSRNLYFLVSGRVELVRHGKVIQTIEAGDYFGEISLLSNLPAIADAIAISEQVETVVIYPENVETLLLEEPKVALKFLKQMAIYLQKSDT